MRLVSILGSAAVIVGAIACGPDRESVRPPASQDAGVDASGGSAGVGGQAVSGGSAGSSGFGGVVSVSDDAGVDSTAPLCSVALKPAGTSVVTLKSNGTNREARLVIPPGYDASKPVPLVILFHGFLGNNAGAEKISQMSVAAAERGVIVAYPKGLAKSWNAGNCCGTSALVGRKDVQFVSDLIDKLEAELCIDPKRIYASGYSNGGMFSHRLACELSERIAAIGTVAGPLAYAKCVPKRPVSVLHFHGTSDFVVPLGGGVTGARSVDNTIEFWRENAGCQDAVPTEVFNSGDTTCTEFSQCQAGAAVRKCLVQGGGHQWPGGESAGAAVGKLTQAIDASETMLDFFEAHPLP